MARPDNWTIEQMEYLKLNYGTSSWDEILKNLIHFTKSQITSKAHHLGLSRLSGRWSNEEVAILKENYSKISINEIMKLLPLRTYDSIITKAGKLNLDIYKNKWTDEELELLKEKYPVMSANELIHYIPNRSKNNITDMASKLGLRKELDYMYKNEDFKKKEMIESLIKFANELGKTPMQNEIEENKLMPSPSTYHRYFGSYSNACIEAGLEPNNQLFGKSHIGISVKGEVCLSKQELLITNILANNDIQYVKEKPYKEIIKDVGLNYIRTDWYVNDKIIVEYFGMPEKEYYKERMNAKIQLCKSNDIPLIDLYPEDTKDKFKGMINKFSKYGIKLVV